MEIRLSSGAEKLTIFQIESFFKFLVRRSFQAVGAKNKQVLLPLFHKNASFEATVVDSE